MLERFARESRRAAIRAQDAARLVGAEQVEPEHLLLALSEGDDPAGRALAEVGVDRAAIEEAIEEDLVATLQVVGVPPSVVTSTPAHPRRDRPGFSAQAKRALEQALHEAVRRGDRRLGTEHVLLGVLRRPGATVARVLVRLDVDPERLAALVQVEAAAQR
jgi:ATP-dependent Clp protease ATP-binding subunit ClpA